MTTPAPEPVEKAAKAVEWVAAVAGPLTALTAVLYFFGWTRTNAVFRYFGVDPAILQFEFADYLARAAGPAFAPAIGVILGTAVLVAVNRAAFALELVGLRHPVTVYGRTYVLRVPSVVLVYGGTVALWCGARVALGIPDYLGIGHAVALTEPIPAAVAFAAGALLMTTGLRLWFLRPGPSGLILPEIPVVARVVVVAAILASLFWATAAYSQRAGEVLAAHINDNPTTQAEVTVYSEQSLDLWSATPPGPGMSGQDAADRRYRFTYTGLRLLAYANDRWLLLTGERSANGRLTTAILHDDDSIRVELNV